MIGWTQLALTVPMSMAACGSEADNTRDTLLGDSDIAADALEADALLEDALLEDALREVDSAQERDADQPMCNVDFPCEYMAMFASCGAQDSTIVPYRTVPCSEICGGRPCSGATCSPTDPIACEPLLEVCVERETFNATCEAIGRTCGNPDGTPCSEDERCVRRTSTTVCEVTVANVHGFCQRPEATTLPACLEPWLPGDEERCDDRCEALICSLDKFWECESACRRATRARAASCVSCILEFAEADCGPLGDGIPDFAPDACASQCESGR